MTAEQTLLAGDPAKALSELQQRIREEPAVARHRVFLFQLLSVLGQWDRARTQLDVLRDLDPATVPMVKTYREVLRCEVLRAEVFAGKRTPLLFGEPAQWAAELVSALKLAAEGKVAESQALRARALEAAPATPGTLTLSVKAHGGGAHKDESQPFEWIADADSRLGPMLEAVVNGKYYWVPFTAIAELRLEKPTDLRDFVWMPASCRWTNGGEAVALLPARYPGSERATAALQLGRATEWQDLGHDLFAGSGQKLLATDNGEWGLQDVRAVRLRPVTA
ncbi:MAG: virulence protein SciE type [Planctomycetes bacterium]|nr:virulence protein SciE type [Planctomycetota bacterium]